MRWSRAWRTRKRRDNGSAVGGLCAQGSVRPYRRHGRGPGVAYLSRRVRGWGRENKS